MRERESERESEIERERSRDTFIEINRDDTCTNKNDNEGL